VLRHSRLALWLIIACDSNLKGLSMNRLSWLPIWLFQLLESLVESSSLLSRLDARISTESLLT